MENYSTYPDSDTSTPRSREHEQHLAHDNYKVKLMCSYGGKILPRPHDNQLTYIGGDTKILTVDRGIRFASISHKLNSLSDTTDVCFKYQLPGEDLDALISVTNDEDLEHMMTEYDRIFRSSLKPVRLRLFMFPLSPPLLGGGESKTGQQWFVDALNAVQISSAQPASENTDFLFGFENGNAPPLKVNDVSASARAGSDCGSEDGNSNRQVISDPVVSSTVDIQRQMQEYQRMQVVGSNEQTMNIDPRAYYGDYYTHKIQPAAATGRYWQDMTNGGYQAGSESPVYLIPPSSGVYPPVAGAGQTLRAASQGQAYYGMQSMVSPPEFYQSKYQEAIGMVRPGEIGYGQVYYTTSQGQGQATYRPLGLGVTQEAKMFVDPKKLP